MSPYTSFAVAGAGPTIGGRIVKALVEQGASVVALLRPSSASISSPLLEGAKIATADYADVKAVASILRENKTQVVISALAYGALSSQSTLADAAKEAGVKLFVPSEFGMPTEGGKAAHTVTKSQFADYLKSSGIPSLRIYTGMFMEFIPQFTGVDLGKFLVLGKGDASFSTTALDDVAGFTAHVLTTLPPAKLHDASFRVEGERTSFNKHVTSLPEGYVKQTLLQGLFEQGRGSSGWDNYADKDVPENANSGNAAWPGHQWKTVKEVLEL
ncbi:NAD(P)-binding protein [Suillus fuscotomentosus]|uniref:NAD(P)-binding protein n=1 Tax=Suillus fuscotomentosus TaxID=1912939 RepID=A0AAD4ELU0_9AGAM|nr:NAD(P)-binding protein [Suillus fuscotomentosus]KAG1908559.1 NAD(P)-binding protein [Suillus fuscotomentosus]